MTSFTGKKGFVNSLLQYAPAVFLMLSASYITEAVVARPYRTPGHLELDAANDAIIENFTLPDNLSETIDVSLNYPDDNTWNTSQTINHGYTPIINNGEFANCSLFTNKTGSWEYSAANATSINNNSVNYISFNYGEDYNETLWNVYCYDTTTVSNYSPVNFTLKIDATPPTTPTLTRQSSYATWIDLDIGGCTDTGSGVATKLLYRNATNIVNLTTEDSYNDTNLSEFTSYSYKLSCLDNAGNYGSNSTTLLVKTSKITQPVEIPEPASNQTMPEAPSSSGELIGPSGSAASSLISQLSTRQIEITQQEYIDSYFNWNFEEINTTHWQASFTIDPALWTDVKSCSSQDGAGRTSCFKGLCDNYFSNKLDCKKTLSTLTADFMNMKNYPLANLTPRIKFSNFSIDEESGTASFYIIFPRGFKEGESAKFGFGSTLIKTYGTETEPFRASGRAICRTNNAIHVVQINGTTNVSYYKSTDGVSWTERKLDGLGSGDNPIAGSEVAIACSGTNVFVVWPGGTSGYNLSYMNSSDEGATWSPYIGNTAPAWWTGSGTSNIPGVYVSAEFGIGNNIWVGWVHDAGTVEAIIVDNSTRYGGNLPTVTRRNMTIDTLATASPHVIVNISGSTEEVYVPNFGTGSDININYTTNGGTTWTGTAITAGTFLAGQLSGVILNNAVYVVYATASAVSIKNSTNRGATWSAAYTVASETTSDPTIVTDGQDTLWVFWNNGTASTNFNDVRYRMYNISTGWGSITTLEELDSYVQTRPNAKFNRSGGRTELVFINRTASSGNIDLRYTYWLPSITFTNPQNNNSNAKPNDAVNFSIDATTNYGFISGYIFSNNFTGSGWQNSSWVPVSGSGGSATIWNASYTATSPNIYGWKFYANITKTDVDNSSNQQFNFSTRRLLATWHSSSPINSTACTQGTPCQVYQYNTFIANATVQCSTQPAGLTCGVISCGMRYNESGTTPNAWISTTVGTTPLYVMQESILPTSAMNTTGNVTTEVNQSDNVYAYEYCSGNKCYTPYLYINFTTDKTYDNITVEGYAESDQPVECWNGTDWTGTGATMPATESSVTGSLENCSRASGEYQFRARSYDATGGPLETTIAIDYSVIARAFNPKTRDYLSDGESFVFNWVVNATGAPVQIRTVDNNFTSDLTNDNPPQNNTQSAYIQITEQVVSFTITLPGQNPIYAAEGGNATVDIEFNLTGGHTASNVVPCLAGTPTCQTDAIPIFQFSNTGTATLNWYVHLTSVLPASMTLKGDTDNNPTGATTITSSGWLVASSIAPLGSQNAWLWTDFSGASVSDATNKNLVSNTTSS